MRQRPHMHQGRLLTVGMAALAALVSVAAGGPPPTTQPGNGKADPDRPDQPAPQAILSVLRLGGSRVVQCKSRWHDVHITSAVAGRVFLPGDRTRMLLPTPPPDGSKDKPRPIPDDFTTWLGRRVFESMELKPDNAEAMQKWLGSGQPGGAHDTLKAGGRLEAALLREEVLEGRGRLIVSVRGEITLEHRSTLGNRFGPNSHKANWTLRVGGELALEPRNGRMLGGCLTVEGNIAGAYTGGDALQEPYTETVKLTLTVDAPPSKEAIARVAALIRQLGDNSYRKREAASAELLKIGPAAVGPLRAALESRDPEVQSRAREILENLGAADGDVRAPAPDKTIPPDRAERDQTVPPRDTVRW